MVADGFQVIPVKGLPLVGFGDDLAGLTFETLKRRGLSIAAGDIIVYSSKLVSKAEGCVVDLKGVKPSRRAEVLASVLDRPAGFVQLVLDESCRVLGVWGRSLVVEDRRGMVCVNAGVDKSNVDGDSRYCLLPLDPFRSAEGLMRGLRSVSGVNRIGVVIADSSTRPYRRGLNHYALGCAGVKGLIDHRGEEDLYGRILRFKVSSVADEVACAAGLAMGEAGEGVGAALIRGLEGLVFEDCRAERLTVDGFEDIYRGLT